MATEVTFGTFAFDLLRDTLGEDQARRAQAAVQAILSNPANAFTKAQSAIVPVAAAGNTTPALTDLTDYDLVFVFSTQACTITFANGGTNVPLAAGGVLILHTAALAYLKVLMGSTAGSVAYFLAT